MKNIRIILSPEAEEVYKYLNQEAEHSKIEKSILNALEKKKDLLKTNPHYGNPIAKNLIPLEYKNKYGVTNLFRIELPNFWRMLYTLTNGENEIEIIAFVLDVLDHNQYNKKFGYKGQ
ncbi:MAG: hypothetical protein WC595_05455 [Candidatus Nanoarchaeia archaeon]